jgi:hypothetical protein
MDLVLSSILSTNPDDYIEWIVRICSVGILISCLELLSRPVILADRGLMSWSVSRLDFHWQHKGILADVLDCVLRYPFFVGLVSLRLVIAVIILFGPRGLILHPLVVWTATFLAMALSIRSRYGIDGADQVANLVFVGLALVALVPTPLTKAGYLWFLAVQCCLAYSVAGVAKLVSAGWRDGTFLPGILSIRTYCPSNVAWFAQRHRFLLHAVSWGVIAGECLFPLVLVLPIRHSLVLLGAGVALHVSIAFVMGLNSFLWAFPSMYPAVLFVLRVRGW